MKHYQYCTIRFAPDKSTQEFVNIGIIAYSADEKLLKFKFREDFTRVSNFFYGVNLLYIEKLLENVKRKILESGIILTNIDLVNNFKFENLLKEIIPNNDYSLQFSSITSGVTKDFCRFVEEIYNLIITKYDKPKSVYVEEYNNSNQKDLQLKVEICLKVVIVPANIQNESYYYHVLDENAVEKFPQINFDKLGFRSVKKLALNTQY